MAVGVEAHRAALEEYPRERAPLEWARTQNSLGVALSDLSWLEGNKERLEEAVAAYESALKERTVNVDRSSGPERRTIWAARRWTCRQAAAVMVTPRPYRQSRAARAENSCIQIGKAGKTGAKISSRIAFPWRGSANMPLNTSCTR